MPKFTVDYKSSHSAPETYSKLKNFLSEGSDLKKFDSKVQCNFNDGQQTCHLEGSQFKADVHIAPIADSGCKVSVTVDLPFLLSPFKGKVQEGLQKMLSKHLS